MGLQARLSEHDDRLYNPGRDVAHCFGDVMREVAARLEDGKWAFLNDLLKEKGVTQDQLGLACKAACEFVATATADKKEKMGPALARAGFWDVPELANVALCAVMGTVLMGYFWVGVREATLGGKGPCLTYQDLRAAGERCHRAMTMSPWGRWWARLKYRFGAAWTALFGRRQSP